VFYVVDESSYDRFNTQANRIYRVNMDLKYGSNLASFAITPPELAATLTTVLSGSFFKATLTGRDLTEL